MGKEISDYLQHQIHLEEELHLMLSKIKNDITAKKDERIIISDFKELLARSNGNVQILKEFATFLQLINDKDLLKEFDLEDISFMYEKICSHSKFDVDLCIEYYYFLFNVLGREEEAISLFQAHKNRILDYFNKFESHTKEI